MKPTPPQNLTRAILKSALRPNQARDEAFRRIIRSVPRGKVSTYGKVAAAAGYPLYHRAVATLLRRAMPHDLPWQRIVGAGGEIKLRGDAAHEQRLRLALEGVTFRGRRVNMELHEHPSPRGLHPRNFAVLVHIDPHRARHFRQPRHQHHRPRNHHQKSRPGR